MNEPVLHVVFGPSAAASLRQSVAQVGRNDEVVCPYDDFRFGPIDSSDSAARVQWVETELGITGWEDVVSATEPFLAASCSKNVHPIAWTSRRDAHSYAGFLWWLHQLGDAPCSLIDMTDLTVIRHDRGGRPMAPQLAVSPTTLHPGEMAKLFNVAVPLADDKRHEYRALWGRLIAENSPLRVIEHGKLASAPIDYFDPLILAGTSQTWQKMAMIVGRALSQFWSDEIYQTGDLFLSARVRALVEAGQLEWHGDLTKMRECELRLSG